MASPINMEGSLRKRDSYIPLLVMLSSNPRLVTKYPCSIP